MSMNGSNVKISRSTWQIAHFLSTDNFRMLELRMQYMNVPAGAHLFWEDEPADRLFYVKKGQVKIVKSTMEGKELILQYLQSGDLFGEIDGLENSTFSVTGTVTKESFIGVIKQDDLDELIYQNGSFAVEFTKWMGLSYRTIQSKFRDLLLYGKNGALASTLIRLTNSYGQVCEDGIRIEAKFTHSDLANMIGTARESVNRLLGAYRDDGVLSYEDGQIIIHNLDYLKSIVSCMNCPAEICRI